jgi:hypothetical protein
MMWQLQAHFNDPANEGRPPKQSGATKQLGVFWNNCTLASGRLHAELFDKACEECNAMRRAYEAKCRDRQERANVSEVTLGCSKKKKKKKKKKRKRLEATCASNGASKARKRHKVKESGTG